MAAAHCGYQSVKASGMRRALVLTDDSAGHPFLASLPPHIRQGVAPVKARPTWKISRTDVRSFFGAYFACFVGALIFIA